MIFAIIIVLLCICFCIIRVKGDQIEPSQKTIKITNGITANNVDLTIISGDSFYSSILYCITRKIDRTKLSCFHCFHVMDVWDIVLCECVKIF